MRVAVAERSLSVNRPQRATQALALTDGEVEQFVRERVSEGDKARARYEALRIAFTCIQFFDGTHGKQWGEWSNRLNASIYPVQDVAWRIRRTINVFQPTAMTMLARLRSREPLWKFNGPPGDVSAYEKARAAERVQEWFYEEQGISRKRRDLIRDLILTGSAFQAVYFDPDAGPAVEDVETGTLFHSGRVRVRNLALEDIIVDPAATRLMDEDGQPIASWVAIREALPEEEVLRRWPKAEARIDRGGDEADVQDPMWRMRTALSGTGTDTGSLPHNRHEVITLFCRPGPDAEHGLTFVTVDGHYVDGGELPYHRATNGRVVYPIAQYRSHILKPGAFWGLPAVSAMTGLQRAFNEVWSSVEEFFRRSTKGNIGIPDGSIQDPEKAFSTESGGIYIFDPQRGAPVFHDMQTPPQGIWSFLQEIEHLIGQTTMVREISRGMAPDNVKTAAGQYVMREVDDSVLGDCAREIELGEESMVRLAFSLMGAFGIDGEIVRYADPDGFVDEFEFKREFCTEGPGMMIEAGSMRPQDQALRQTALVQAIEARIVTPQEARRRMGTALENDDPRSLEARNRTRAKRNIRELISGRPVEVKPYWMHEIHLEELNKFRLDDRYLNAPPFIQALVDATVEQHEQYLMRAAGVGAGLAASMAGGEMPGEEGEGMARGTPRNPMGPPSKNGGQPGLTTTGMGNVGRPPPQFNPMAGSGGPPAGGAA